MKTQDDDKIRKTIEAEFPDDFAIQQIHIARKILAREAAERGLSFIEYIISLNESKTGAK